MRYFILTLAMMCSAPQGWADVTYGTASSDTGTTQTSQSHTIAADENAIVIFVGVRDEDGTADAVTSVTVGASSATLIAGCTATVGIIRVEAWGLLNPPTGAQTIVANGVNSEQMSASALSFKGAGSFSACVTDTFSGEFAVDTDGISSSATAIAVQGLTFSGTTTCDPDATAPTSTERLDFDDGVNISGCAYTEAGASPTVDIRVDLGAARTGAALGLSILAGGRVAVSPILFQ